MPTKPETILKKIDSLPNHQSTLCLKFKEWLEYENDNSERNWINYFKVLSLFADHIGNKAFRNITRDDVLSFLDKRKKSVDVDPEKKWIVTWNGYLSRLLGFYRRMYNNNNEQDRENWVTPEIFSSIKRKKNKRISSYNPTDVWNIEEQGFVVKQSYSSQIINGTKKHEFRNFRTTKLNVPIYLLSEGMVLGQIMFTGIKENNKDWKYTWKIKVLKKFVKPWRYSHPQGAQRWVKKVSPKR